MRKTFLLLLASLIAVPASADVTVMSQVSNGGFMGWGASKGTQLEQYQGGMRSRHETPGAIATLTLLDEDVIRHLNLKKKTYTEQSLKELRDAMKKAMETKEEEPSSSKPQKESPPTHRISRAEFKVTNTGKSKTLHEFPCKEFILEMLLEIEDLKTHEKGQTRMISTLWTTPETAALKQVKKEEAEFAQAYLKKMDMPMSPKDLSKFGAQMAAAMTGAGKDELSKALGGIPSEMKKISGTPIVTQVDWYIHSDEAASAKQEVATDAEPSDPINTDSVSSALGSFASNFAKKKTNQKIAEHQKAQEGKPLISITTEIASVSTNKIPAADFAVPAGFKKIENKK